MARFGEFSVPYIDIDLLTPRFGLSGDWGGELNSDTPSESKPRFVRLGVFGAMTPGTEWLFKQALASRQTGPISSGVTWNSRAHAQIS